MARTIPENQHLWALYIDARHPLEGAADDYQRRQWVVLPPLDNAPANSDASMFRYLWRNQASKQDKSRWRGPRTRTAQDATLMINSQHYLSDDTDWDVMTLTVPVYEKELLDLKFEDKPTIYRVIDRAKRVAKKKHGKIV